MVPFLTLTVADAMSPEPLTVRSDSSLATLRDIFEAHRYSAVPVVDDDKLSGWVSQFDLLKAFVFQTDAIIPPYDRILNQPASSVMLREPECVSPDQPISRVLMRMIDTRHRSFPVVDNGKLVGVIAREDILEGLRREIGGQG